MSSSQKKWNEIAATGLDRSAKTLFYVIREM